MTVTGIDVSHHQGLIDWDLVHGAGYSFVFHKATEGTGFVDRRLDANVRAATAAGLSVGVYHFARPHKNTPEAEARHFLDVLAPLASLTRLRPVLDIEDEHANGDLTGWAVAWLQAVEARIGVPPILYTYAPYAAAHLRAPLDDFPLWLAAYRTDEPKPPKPWKRWTVWQHTSSGAVPGIAGRVDLNKLADGVTLDDISLAPTEDDDMLRYIDWPAEDKKALAKDIGDALLARLADDAHEVVANRIRKAAHAAQHLHDHAGLKD